MLSRRRSSSTGDLNGVLAVAVFLDYFNQFYRTLNRDGADSITLVRADGSVLVREPAATTGLNALTPASGLMRNIAVAPSGSYLTVSELDGISRHHAYEKVGKFPVFVTYGVNLVAVRAAWLRTVATYGVFAGLGSIGLARAERGGQAALAHHA